MIKLFFEGFIIGLAKIIPGVSGAIFAMLFKVYEPIVEVLSHPTIILKKAKVIIPLGLGIIFAIIFGSGIIKYFLDYYYVYAMSLFIGLMSYGIIPLIKDNKGTKLEKYEIITCFIIFLCILSLIFIRVEPNVIANENIIHKSISLFLCGLLDAFSSIVPGISGTALLMMVGYYSTIIEGLSNVKIDILVPFLIGLLVGLMFIAKIMNYLFKNHKNAVNISILFFAVFSIVKLSLSLIDKILINDIFICLILFFVGFIISYLLEFKGH